MSLTNAPALTYDILLAAGKWKGREAELHRIAAEYTLDGVRLGGLDFQTVSASVHDSRLVLKRAEVEAVAYILARLGYADAELVTLDAQGAELERPDVDVLVGKECWGFEVAFGIDPAVAKGEAEQLRIERTIRDLLDTDPAFRRSFGSGHLWVQLESDRQPLGRGVGNKIIQELTRFIRSGDHRKGADDDGFGAVYPTVRDRGASFSLIRDAGEPYFSAAHGSSIVDRSDSVTVVLETLDRHRKQAATYRHRRNWCAIHIPDVLDIFRPTVPRLATLRPQIAPFEKVFVRGPSGRIVAFEERAGSVAADDVAH